MYNIEPKKAVNIKVICHRLNFRYKIVEKSQYGYSLEYLAGLCPNAQSEPYEDFDREMLVFINFSSSALDKILRALRRKNSTVDLKALLTDKNIGFNSYELYREISAEHEAMKRGEAAHTQQ